VAKDVRVSQDGGDAGVEQDRAQQVAQSAPGELAIVKAVAVGVAGARVGEGAVAPPASEPREEDVGVEVEARSELLPGKQCVGYLGGDRQVAALVALAVDAQPRGDAVRALGADR